MTGKNYDDVEYLEFIHEVVLFDMPFYRVEKGEDGIESIHAGPDIITHKDGRTAQIPWACVREWD